MSHKCLRQRGHPMFEPLDIFVVDGGSATWLGSAETLKQALNVVLKHSEGSYFVFSQQTDIGTFTT